MSDKQRAIGLKQFVEASLPVWFEVGVVCQKQEAASFERLLADFVEFLLLAPSDLIEGIVHEGHDVIAVEDDVHSRQPLADSQAVTIAHVHGNCLELLRLSGKLLDEWADVLFAPSFHGMKDSTGFQIRENRHVFMAFPDAELIDSDVSDISEFDLSIDLRKSRFMDLLDQVPSDSKIGGNGLDGAKLEKILHGESKGSDVAVFAISEGNWRPPSAGAFPAFQSVDLKIEKTSLSSHLPPGEEVAFSGP